MSEYRPVFRKISSASFTAKCISAGGGRLVNDFHRWDGVTTQETWLERTAISPALAAFLKH